MTATDDRRYLLNLARRTIRSILDGSGVPKAASSPEGGGGAFVTLKKNERLRGCIGLVRAEESIAETVIEMSRAAAFQDPRFSPLTLEELDDVVIEISRISDFFPITPEDVQVGTHGLFLRKGARSGLLLPQVPGEQGWNRAAFLSGLCRKAGLPDGSWAFPDAELMAFTAEVFTEGG